MPELKKIKILWTDDEIDLLRPHILFLQEKGYDVVMATNGDDAIEQIQNNHFDLVLLDENMPGISGIETLNKIKVINSTIPVVMITKSEEENIMETAIGSKIADYLIKPVNPNQILLSIKKNLDTKKLITRETNSAYQSEFRNLGYQINMAGTYKDWEEIYRKLVYWELELERLKCKNQKPDLVSDDIYATIIFPGFQKKQPSAPCFQPVFLRRRFSRWWTRDKRYLSYSWITFAWINGGACIPLSVNTIFRWMIPCSAASFPPPPNMPGMQCLPD
jgi:DNA-binding response OmpR family regulator